MERPPAPLIPDGGDPHLRRATAPGGGDLPRRADVLPGSSVARAIDDGEPAFLPTNREIEENFWRAIRWGLGGELIDLRTHEVRPTRAAIEELIEWVQPVAEELGVAEYLTIPATNAAERQIARHEEGASLEEIYAEQVRRREAVGG